MIDGQPSNAISVHPPGACPCFQRGNAELGDLSPPDKLHKLATDILELAIDHLNQPQVLDQFAHVLFAKIKRFDNSNRITAKLRASEHDLRHSVVKAIIPLASVEQSGVFTTIEACAVTSADVPWLLAELAIPGQLIEIRRLVAQIVSRMLGPDDVEAFNAVWEAASTDPELRAAIDWLVRPIELDSPEATQMREIYRRMSEDRTPAPPVEEIPLEEALREILSNPAPETFVRLELTLRDRATDPAHDRSALPGW